MTNQEAQMIADMANAAEAAILSQASAEMRDWYLALPRESRIEIAMNAAHEAAKSLA